MPDGAENPIAFASLILASAEKKYSQLEKEGLAVVFLGVKKFHSLLFGRYLEITNERKPLIHCYQSSACISFSEDTKMGTNAGSL